MVYVTCPSCGETMECTDTDSRGEWTEETYECETCGKKKIHRTDYDQNGLVTNDEVFEDD